MRRLLAALLMVVAFAALVAADEDELRKVLAEHEHGLVGENPGVGTAHVRKLLGGGAPDNWQNWGGPVDKKVWQWQQPAIPRPERRESDTRRLLSADASGPASHQFSTAVPAEVGMKPREPHLDDMERLFAEHFAPAEVAEDKPRGRNLLGGGAPDNWQNWGGPVDKKVWQWQQPAIPRPERRESDTRRLLSADASGPASHQFSTAVPAEVGMKPREPHLDDMERLFAEHFAPAEVAEDMPRGRNLLGSGGGHGGGGASGGNGGNGGRTGPAWVRRLLGGGAPDNWQNWGGPVDKKVWQWQQPAIPRPERRESDTRRLLSADASGPASHQFSTAVPAEVGMKPREPHLDDMERLFAEHFAPAEVAEDKPRGRNLLGGGAPDNWQNWGGPVDKKVWQWQQPAIPRPERRESDTRRLLSADASGPASHQFSTAVPAEVGMKPREPHLDDMERLFAEHFAPAEVAEDMPRGRNLLGSGGGHGGGGASGGNGGNGGRTGPAWVRRLLGGGAPDNWQNWGGPVDKKVWQWQQPAIPRPERRESDTRRLLSADASGPASHQFSTAVPAEVGMKPREPHLDDMERLFAEHFAPAEVAEDKPRGRNLLGGGAPDNWQNWGGPVDKKVWQWQQPAIPRPERRESDTRRLLSADASGPASHQFSTAVPAEVGMKPREPHLDDMERLFAEHFAPAEVAEDMPRGRNLLGSGGGHGGGGASGGNGGNGGRTGPAWVRRLLGGGAPDNWQNWGGPVDKKVWQWQQPAIPRPERRESDTRRLLSADASGPASHQFSTAVPAEVGMKPREPHLDDMERLFAEHFAPAEVAEDKPRGRNLLGGGAPDNWQNWGGPVDKKVWQWQQPAIPRPERRESDTRRLLSADASGPASHQFSTAVPAEVGMKPREPHLDDMERLFAEHFAPAEVAEDMPRGRNLLGSGGGHGGGGASGGNGGNGGRTGPAWVRRLLGGGAPDNWQNWGGPVDKKVWQWQQPAIPRPERRESDTRRLLSTDDSRHGPASWGYRMHGQDKIYELLKQRPKGEAPVVPDDERFNRPPLEYVAGAGAEPSGE
ncbi:hypothetical protein HT031_005292 [Scenedesmus sp. PABB004]|nr:hypothetical protein HT031_005292 [Scenedesmus sp. PABB004]